MVTLTAATVLAQNGYTQYDATEETGDFTYTVVEYVIDDCINMVNLLADQDMTEMSGTAETKTVTITRDQATAVKMLISMVLRENKKTGLTNSSTTSGSESASSSVNVGPIGASESSGLSTAIGAAATINNPANSIFVNLFKETLAALKNVEIEADIG